MYGICGNVIAADKAFRLGAKVWVAQLSGDIGRHGEFWGPSRGGRNITKWAPMNRVGNYRVAWLPPHLRRICGACAFDDRSGAEREAERVKAAIGMHGDYGATEHPHILDPQTMQRIED